MGGGEPGVEGIFVAEVAVAADFDFVEVDAGVEDPLGRSVYGRGGGDVVGGVVEVEHGDGNAPGDLAGDVPIFETFEVVDEDFLFALGVEFDFAGFEMGNGGFSKFLRIDKPLLAEHGFDDGATLVAVGDSVGDFLFATKEAFFLKIGQNFFATFFGSEAGVIWAANREHTSVGADDGEFFEVVTFADFEVVVIMGGSNLDGAGAVFHLGVFVGDDGYFPFGKGELDFFVDNCGVASILWINCDGHITKESFGTSGGDDNFAIALDVGVGDVPESALFVFVLNLDVGEGGLMLRTEVDKFFTSVNHAVVPHFFEGVVNASDDVFVEGEGEVFPGAAGAEGAELKLHVSPLFLDEVPDLGIELFAGVVETGFPLCFEGAFVDDPSFEAGMIGAGDVPTAATL